MRRVLHALLLLALAFVLIPVAASQQTPPEERAEPEQPEESREAKEEQEDEAARPVPIYVPPARGAVRTRVGAATHSGADA